MEKLVPFTVFYKGFFQFNKGHKRIFILCEQNSKSLVSSTVEPRNSGKFGHPVFSAIAGFSAFLQVTLPTKKIVLWKYSFKMPGYIYVYILLNLILKTTDLDIYDFELIFKVIS